MCKVDVIKIDALKLSIYNSLMSMPDMGLGDMADASDEADRIVDDWVEQFFIKVEE
jgi:hypothetical protein